MLRAYLTCASLALASCGDFESSHLERDDTASQVGAKGEKGDKGETGAKGEKGAASRNATLVDQTGKELGYYLSRVDFDAGTYEIITTEGLRTVVDIDDASYKPPVQLASGLGFSCMYTTNDCTGTCYGIDTRARGYILNGPNGAVFQVDPGAATTSISSQSRNTTVALNTCTVAAAALPNAVAAATYTGVLTQSLSTPLYFKIVN